MYNSLLKTYDNLLSPKTYLYIKQGVTYVSISKTDDYNISETFEAELDINYRKLLKISADASTCNTKMSFKELLDRVPVDSHEKIIYWVFSRWFERLLKLDNFKDHEKTVVIKYQSKHFSSLLKGLPEGFIETYNGIIKTAIIDVLESITSFGASKPVSAFKACMVGKCYITDIAKILNSNEVIDYPNRQKKSYNNVTIEDCYNIIQKEKE